MTATPATGAGTDATRSTAAATAAGSAAAGDETAGRPWTADLGDGTYRNPVLNADWSDPDVVRVGEDYYLTASSFGRAPGLPLLQSRDLVNWSLVGHALERLAPPAAFTAPRHDCGVWAPSIRHHDDRFWIFWGDPDHGIQQINAPGIRGPWTEPHLVKAGKGLIDPCPLWDENGEAYLVHAWAKSRSGVKNRLTGHRMSPDGRELLDEGRTVVDADRLPGWFTLEGPKAFTRDGWFWILAPAGGVETGWQGAFRARDFYGPYEERVVLAQGGTEVNGPHQGALVTTPAGEDWFLHFQARGPYGRVVHLQPVRWDTGTGWPVFGDEGEPVLVHRKPALPEQPAEAPATDDDFPGGRFGRQWQWTANPGRGWTVAHGGDGLRLSCRRVREAHDLRLLPSVLTQRLPAETFTATVALELESGAEGARAGLAVLGDAFSWIGLERGPDGVRLVHRFAESAAERERDAEYARPAPLGCAVLRVEVGPGARCRFSADTSGTGEDFRPSGQVFSATPWRWVGALLGLFAVTPEAPGTADTPGGPAPAGTALFTHFRITA
ncbi:glycoside hydrolase 43 family protein [Streptomyces sp. GC420]|uniref:glycoside hydrolase family 43 protein n=1 Tax=Streptomyces sp. GC420 TaxID=2697568 RepID=UPI001414D6CA|nr:glycoside hydrolase 43 family protein [Streptomyces sp. GC420]NBM18301.1 family 43 glycosylhydrolase [Streptomyces sp. GC420]